MTSTPFVLQTSNASVKDYCRHVKLMGNNFTITVVSDEAAFAAQNIDVAIDEIRRLEKLLNTDNNNSQTNRVNAQAGIAPVKMDEEVFKLVERSLHISSITQGAFDISYGSIAASLWNFDKTMTSLPDKIPDLHCTIVDDNNQIYTSDKIRLT